MSNVTFHFLKVELAHMLKRPGTLWHIQWFEGREVMDGRAMS